MPDPLQARQQEPRRGNITPQEHPNQIVVTAAAAETASEIGNIDFNDRSRVISEPARERRIEFDSLIHSARFRELKNLAKIVDAAGANFVRADEFDQTAKNIGVIS